MTFVNKFVERFNFKKEMYEVSYSSDESKWDIGWDVCSTGDGVVFLGEYEDIELVFPNDHKDILTCLNDVLVDDVAYIYDALVEQHPDWGRSETMRQAVYTAGAFLVS